MLNQLLQQYLQFEDFFREGGILMLPLMVVSMLMWLLIMERFLVLRKLHHRNMPLEIAMRHIRENRRANPREYAGVISMLVNRFVSLRSGQRELDQFILDESVLCINHRLKDRLTFIAVLAAIAPLLGLLGTVTGMIGTFEVMSIFGTGNAKAMAGGISEALITTETGLIVAIPGLYMHHFLSRRVTNLQQRVAAAGLYLRRNI